LRCRWSTAFEHRLEFQCRWNECRRLHGACCRPERIVGVFVPLLWSVRIYFFYQAQSRSSRTVALAQCICSTSFLVHPRNLPQADDVSPVAHSFQSENFCKPKDWHANSAGQGSGAPCHSLKHSKRRRLLLCSSCHANRASGSVSGIQ